MVGWRLKQQGGKWCLLRALGTTPMTLRCQDSVQHVVGGKGSREDRSVAPPSCQLDNPPTQLWRDFVLHLRDRSHQRHREVKRNSSGSASN